MSSASSHPTTHVHAVLIHGFHLDAPDWEHVVWGDPLAGLLGRVPRALLAALAPLMSEPRAGASLRQPTALTFGTGASWREGRSEAAWARDLALERCGVLASCAEALLGLDHGLARTRLLSLLGAAHLDEESTNTCSELRSFLTGALTAGASRVSVVSSPTHLSRSLQQALACIDEFPHLTPLRARLSFLPADTSVPDTSAAQVVVFEPSHRPDRLDLPTAATAAATREILADPERASGFHAAWAELAAAWSEPAGAPAPDPGTLPR